MNKEMYGHSPMFGVHLALAESDREPLVVSVNDPVTV